LVGVFFHWLGGLASASFYVPYRRVKTWAWETYWLVGGFFSWIIVPWILAFWMTSDLIHVLQETPSRSLFWAYTFGVLWGLGGLTFGLTMRYLLDNLATRHPASVRICTLLHKPSRVRTLIPIEYLGFTIPDLFVVGYGLDEGERYRNLPFIGILKPGKG